MGKATGVFLILAGLGTAALVLPNVDKDAEQQLADAVRAAIGGTPQADGRAIAALPGASGIPLPRPLTRPVVTAVPAPPAADKVAAATATVDYGRPPVLIAPPQAIVRNAVAAPHATDGQARQGLARDIQRELKRVGCYDGEVNGEWSANTRQAMKTFIDRVNAALPVDEPDHILRTMVQGHPGHACGVACPSGLSAQQGRCRPSNGIVAQAPAPRAVDGLRARDPASAAHEIAGARPSVPRPAWETTVAAAPSAPPAQVNLEGRMAIGAQLPDAPSGHAAARPGVIVLAPSADPRRAAVARAQSGALAGIIVPGAIAALGGPSTASGAIRTGAIAGAAGLNPGAFPAPAVVIPPDGFEPPVANLPRPRDRDGQPQAARRERPVRTYVPPRPAKFTFPAPSYLIGGNDSKYAASSKTSKSKPFSHFFEWSAGGGGGR